MRYYYEKILRAILFAGLIAGLASGVGAINSTDTDGTEENPHLISDVNDLFDFADNVNNGESYEGQLAVGAVVMNRVRSSAYPDTVHGVIYASGQFTPALNGKVNRVLESGKIYPSCIQAAEEALSGVSNVGDMTHFRRNNGREGLVIGNHVFY